MQEIPNLADIKQVHKKIKNYIHNTPVLSSTLINQLCGANIYFKCENFQKAGAFKFRGASNAVFSLPEAEARRGVATHSSGNHAGALALAAKKRGINAYIVMPENAPRVKVNAVKSYGGKITFCTPTLKAREETLEEIIEQTKAVFIHPYNNTTVIKGQATATLELLNEIKAIDQLIAPVGGGGLLSGTAIAAKGINPGIKVFGAEPAGADDALQSFRAGRIIPQTNPQTIADGLLTSLGKINFTIISRLVDDIVSVNELSIVKAMRLIWERMKIIVEPSSAVPLAAVLEQKINTKGKKTGIIISGGNVELSEFPLFVLNKN